MATFAREVLSLGSMDCRIFCAGMSYVGINIAGTWSGTISFSADQTTFGLSGPQGGGDFRPTSVFVQPTAPVAVNVVQSVTMNGSWYWPVQNYSTFRAVLTGLTSGQPIVTLATSLDSSWADAFLTSGQRFRNVAANGVLNRMTIIADGNMGWKVTGIVISAAAQSAVAGSSSGGPSVASWSQNPVLQIKDNATRLFGLDFSTTLPFQYTVPIKDLTPNGEGYFATPGNPLVIELASGGNSVLTNINAAVGYG